MPEVKTYTSLNFISRESWNECFAGLESYDYLLATEQANIPDFSYGYIVAEGGGKLLAAAPVFITEYNLDTTLEDGFTRKSLLACRKTFPNFLKLKLACLGSPVTEQAYFGFHNSVSENEKPALLNLLFAEFDSFTKTRKTNLLGIKDLSATDKLLLEKSAYAKKYKSVASMPTAYLPINFADVDSYIATLSYKTRKDMRRKLKSAEALRVEQRHNIDDVLDEIHARYISTRERSDLKFEELPKEFFQLMLANKNNSLCILYYAGEKLIAANFFLLNENTLLDKYFCSYAEDAREHNIYFISWFENIKYCLQNGLKTYIAGQAGYENKRRLQCSFQQNFLAFRHRNPAINFILKMAAPLLAADLGEADEE